MTEAKRESCKREGENELRRIEDELDLEVVAATARDVVEDSFGAEGGLDLWDGMAAVRRRRDGRGGVQLDVDIDWKSASVVARSSCEVLKLRELGEKLFSSSSALGVPAG